MRQAAIESHLLGIGFDEHPLLITESEISIIRSFLVATT